MMFGNGINGIERCWGYGNGLMPGGWGMIIMLGITALVVAGVVILAKKKVNRSVDNIAMDALKMKLAKGEITVDEYIRRKTILE